MKLKFIFLIFLIGCSKVGFSNKKSCANNGDIHFMYVNVPCEECVMVIEEVLDLNSNIFDYNMVRNQDSHILINYCYNPKETDILFIEKSISDIGLLVNQARGSSNIISDNLCCSSQ